jgi:hypothetical protein
MWQGRPRPCCKAEAALPHHAHSVLQLLHKNQSQNLSCFRQWEFRSLGDLGKSSKRLNDSETPKLPLAKAKEFKDKGQKTKDRGCWLLNAKRLPAQSFVFCLLSFVLQ